MKIKYILFLVKLNISSLKGRQLYSMFNVLTHWGRATHICVSNLTIIASDKVLSPARRQAIIWTNAGISLVGPLAINFSDILIEIEIFSFKKMYLQQSSAKWRLLRFGLNVLNEFLAKVTDACMGHYSDMSCPW